MKHLLRDFVIGFNSLFAVLLILSLFQILPLFYSSKLVYFFYALLVLDTLYLVLVIREIPEDKRDGHLLLASISYTFIGLLMLLAVNQFLKRAFITAHNWEIIALAFMFGFLTFYSRKDKVEKELDDEKEQEVKAEEARKKEFAEKFPKLSRVWGLRQVSRWVYKEGFWYVLILAAIVGVGAFFYFWGLGNYGFQQDEAFHINVVKTYFETGKFPYIGDTYYPRGIFVSFLTIIFKYLSNFMNLNDEILLRLPIVLFSLTNIILIYLLSKSRINKRFSLLIALVFATEIWFFYFGKTIRFYSPALTVILSSLLLVSSKKINLKTSLISATIISIVAYFVIIDYFLFIASLFGLLSIWVLIKEKKYKLLILIAIPLAIIGIRKIFLQTLDTAGVYNLITWNFNAVSVEKYFDWIYINYGLMFALFLAGMLFISFKQIKKYILEIYVIANLLFIFGYVGNVPHNFGFREFFFFLPVLFIISIINLKRIFSKYKLVVYFILGIIVISNFYAIIAYPVNYEGAKYYTTKPLFEKMDINIGNKDMASFVNNYTNYSTNYKIVYIGLGEDLFNYYLKDNIRVYTTFRDSVLGKANIQDLKDFISKNKGSDILIVISANAYANRVNWLYYYIWNGRKYVTEISTSFEDYVEKSANSSEIYKSKDGFSKIYLYRA